MAASLTESKTVFQKRCDELLTGLKDDLRGKGIESFSQLAFAIGTPQTPPSATEMADFCNDIRVRPSLGDTAAIKRLHFEGVTLVMAELKQQVAATDPSEPSKRLPFLEKQTLLEAQKTRITGLTHKGEQLPSHALIDAAYSIIESGNIVYLAPSRCGSRDAEIQTDAKQKPKQIITLEQGSLKSSSNDSLSTIDVGTEMRLMYAMQRRGLAFDLVRLISWSVHQQWTNKLFSALASEPPDNFQAPTITSLLKADRELFMILAAEVTGSLKATPHTLDAHVTRLMLDPRILVFLAPTPRTVKRAREEDSAKDKKNDKDKNPKGPPKRVSSLPPALEGLKTKTTDGKPICWHFNLEKRCSNTVKKGRCKLVFTRV